MTSVLNGLRVLDLSWVVAGPLIGRTLADFGAEVIRVESSVRIETARLMPPFQGGEQGVENSMLYGNANAGKRGITVDLSSEAGRKVVAALASKADVLIESFSPGLMARWGLDFDTLSAGNPGLIMLSTSLMGQSGPLSTLAGFGNIGASASGFQNLVGYADRLPFGPFGPYTDYVGPRLALVALLAALADRDSTGTGRYLDVSQVEAGVFFLSPQCAHYFADGVIAQRQGNADTAYAPHGVYPSRSEDGTDRFVAVAVTEDVQWPRLADVIGRLDLLEDKSMDSVAGRRSARDDLDTAIAQWTSARTAAEAERALQEAGVPAHRSASSQDFTEDEQLVHRGHLVSVPHSLHGHVTVEGPRYRLSRTPGGPRTGAPTLGQHNNAVLADELGYSADEIADLHAAGTLN
ncbi:CoA transferase [Rhodococcus sp. KBS0724]|jgi:benzylsuccinate CoA-transferase BbsF subunit|uniref:CaiB/BaiF CoA transferase family protein n=1 Tax=Rhodococcus sp. KBS0724 TaxID=1179674 RepID=UPI00110D368A|nr:CoA transferase [Rhodococcus sp. KBS0724]TSD49421.1 CoA transferase [Rhodococcus sp. KBS0724]